MDESYLAFKQVPMAYILFYLASNANRIERVLNNVHLKCADENYLSRNAIINEKTEFSAICKDYSQNDAVQL